jgi:predicted RNase H-like nuclease
MAVSSGGELPYKIVAGTLPVGSGWLLVSARLKGATFAPDFPRVSELLYDIVHRRPAFTIIALNAPIGDVERAVRGARTCDLEASALLGGDLPARRWRGVTPRLEAEDTTPAGDEGLVLGARLREVTEVMASYLQRTVCEVVPELTFYQLNGEVALSTAPGTDEGYLERRHLLTKFPGVSRILDANEPGVTRWDLLDAAALLWSARRISARAGRRLPASPEWDEQGLRIEILR